MVSKSKPIISFLAKLTRSGCCTEYWCTTNLISLHRFLWAGQSWQVHEDRERSENTGWGVWVRRHQSTIIYLEIWISSRTSCTLSGVTVLPSVQEVAAQRTDLVRTSMRSDNIFTTTNTTISASSLRTDTLTSQSHLIASIECWESHLE